MGPLDGTGHKTHVAECHSPTVTDFTSRVPETTLVGLVGCLLLTDLALAGGGRTEAAGLALAAGAGVALALAFALGIVRSPTYAVAALLATPFVAWYAVSGLLLPWTSTSFWLGQLVVELLLAVPVVGEPLAQALLGGFTLSPATLDVAYRTHYALVVLATVGLLAGGAWYVRQKSAETASVSG